MIKEIALGIIILTSIVIFGLLTFYILELIKDKKKVKIYFCPECNDYLDKLMCEDLYYCPTCQKNYEIR